MTRVDERCAAVPFAVALAVLLAACSSTPAPSPKPSPATAPAGTTSLLSSMTARELKQLDIVGKAIAAVQASPLSFYRGTKRYDGSAMAAKMVMKRRFLGSGIHEAGRVLASALPHGSPTESDEEMVGVFAELFAICMSTRETLRAGTGAAVFYEVQTATGARLDLFVWALAHAELSTAERAKHPDAARGFDEFRKRVDAATFPVGGPP